MGPFLNYLDRLKQRANLGPPAWLLPFTVGVLTYGFVWIGQAPPGIYADFDYLWAGGVAAWQGENPYQFVQGIVDRRAGVGPDVPRLRSPYYYPATAAVLMAPFGALSRQAAAALFTALGMVLLCWSVRGWQRWMVISAPAFQAIIYGQWSPWLTAAVALPWLGFVWAAKPSIGAGPVRRLAVALGIRGRTRGPHRFANSFSVLAG